MIEDFRRKLESKAGGTGGVFGKVDFHIHYPGVGDYVYTGADAMKQLASELTGGDFKAAVVLQHQEFPSKDALQALQKLCPRTVLLPGAEINVFVDTLTKKVSKDHYFHCIVAADPNSEWSHLLHNAKRTLTYRDGDYPAGFHSSIHDVAKTFTEEGALFIPAHLHQSKQPHNSRSIDDIYEDDAFLSFVETGLFSALEVRDASTAMFFDGTKQTKEGKPIPRAICVQSSDAHRHEHVRDRQRFTWLQMEKPSFAEVKAGLSFRHRVSLTPPALAHSRVQGLHISGSFIVDQWLAFNSGMNCLIGCKGSGKTAILECLRFVLNTDVPGDRKESVPTHIQHILGPSAFVECLVTRADGTEALLIRRADSPNRIKVVEQDGRNLELDAGGRPEFSAAILGWHEIEAVADHATARIRLIDRIEGEREARTAYDAIDRKIEFARDLLPTLQQKLRRLDEQLRTLWSLQKKRQTLKKLEQGDLLDLQTRYEQHLQCEQELQSLQQQVKAGSEQVRQKSDSAFQLRVSTVSENMSVPDVVRQANPDATDCIAVLQEALKGAIAGISIKEATVLDRLKERARKVQEAFATFRHTEYEPKVSALPPDEREILTRQIQIIEETKGLPDIELKCSQLLAEVRQLAGQMHSFCDEICRNRSEIWRIREANISAINRELPQLNLSFEKSANQSRRDSFRESFREDAGEFCGYVDSFGGSESYEKLRSLFAKLRDVDMTEESWTVKDLLWDAKFVEFLRVVDDDDVSISMQVGQAGFVPIQNLSAGQRCTAVFPLLLRNTRGPLVIDQPEDNLDNRHIAEVIAPDLLLKKRNQQFIATSHNANLVVLTDADLILHAESNGKSGEFVQRGFFSCAGNPIKNSVIEVLDGGEQALLARQRKYGIGK
jgi:DNA repair ATPase RecN